MDVEQIELEPSTLRQRVAQRRNDAVPAGVVQGGLSALQRRLNARTQVSALRTLGQRLNPGATTPEGLPPVEAQEESSPTVLQQMASSPVVQRIKRGDFPYLAPLRLDVDTWEQFEERVQGMDLYGLSIASILMEPHRLDSEDAFEAYRLINRQKYLLRDRRPQRRARRPPRDEFDEPQLRMIQEPVEEQEQVLEDIPEEEEQDEQQVQNLTDAEELQEQEQPPKLVICDGAEAPALIRTASDLLVWLISHPLSSEETPKGFGELPIMFESLNKLAQKDRVLEPDEVWEMVRGIVAPEASSDSDSNDSDDSEDDSEHSNDSEDSEDDSEHSDDSEEAPKLEWPEGEWNIGEFGIRLPGDYHRDLSEQERAGEIQQLKARLQGMKYIGTHFTVTESLGPLLSEGVSSDRMGTGGGLGKGRGFYVVPTDKKKDLKDSQELWGDHLVAVFLPNDCSLHQADDGLRIEELEEEFAGKRYFYAVGAGTKLEVIIPESLFDEIILVRDPADITVARRDRRATKTGRAGVDILTNLLAELKK